MQVASDQIGGMLTFSMETGWSSACARKAGRSRSDLNPMWTVSGEIDRLAQEKRGFELRKWFRMMTRPPGRQTRRISSATCTGSGTTDTRQGAETMSKKTGRAHAC